MNAINRIFFITSMLCLISLITRAQVPAMNSLPASDAVIYLDFDGEYISGTSWNWDGPIYAQNAQLLPESIREVFDRVSEDFRPFNLNVTTDSSVYQAAPFDKRIRVIITVTSNWYGKVGGISYIGSFTWGDDTPAWVFSNVLNYSAKYIAEVCAHEAGHTLGLYHQSTYDTACNKLEEYASGNGDGETGWAPIMGLSYYKNWTTWHNGPNSIGCTHYQDDLEIIAGPPNGVGFRADDHGNSPASATALNMQIPGVFIKGLINIPGDVDVYKFNLPQTTYFKLNAIPQNIGSNNAGADVDLKISLLNSTGDTNGIYNPLARLDAVIDTMLNAGRYYIVVQGTGNTYHSEYGSLGLYSLVATINKILPLESFILKAGFSSNNDMLEWNYTSDEKISKIIVETSDDGVHFQSLIALPPEAKSYAGKHSDTTGYYRLKAVMLADGRAYYSNIIRVDGHSTGKPVQLYSNMVKGSATIASSASFSYLLYDEAGRLLRKGVIFKGVNHIDLSQASPGILFMRISNGVIQWTEKIIKQ